MPYNVPIANDGRCHVRCQRLSCQQGFWYVPYDGFKIVAVDPSPPRGFFDPVIQRLAAAYDALV